MNGVCARRHTRALALKEKAREREREYTVLNSVRVCVRLCVRARGWQTLLCHRHASGLLPSGWLIGAEGGMVSAVKLLAEVKTGGLKST